MAKKPSDAVFINGRVYTFDRTRKRVRALCIESGRLVDVGSDAEMRRLASRDSQRYDLKGRVVVPGFIDCHTHFIQMGLDMMTVDLSATASLDEAMALMRGSAGRLGKDEWLVGTSWKESGWPNGRYINREDLDGICPDRPAVAHRVCGHLSTVNSKALELLDIGASVPDVDRDASGRPTGILRESAVSIARDATAPDRALKEKALRLALKKAHSLGVTSVQDNGHADDLDTYRHAESRGNLSVRVWLNTPHDRLDSRLRLHLSTGIGSEWLKLGGLKIFCDGALGARTAALTDAYEDDPGNQGMLIHEPGRLDEMVRSASDAGIQVAIHAIGDVGIGTAIRAIASGVAKGRESDHRHRIEHLELPSKAHLDAMRKAGIVASMQPNFVGEWGGTEGMYVARLGKVRAARNNPFREVIDGRVRLVFGSDCMPFSPLYGIHSAVNAPYPAQRISVWEAISAYTRDAASASFEESLKGSLAVGKLADFAVLSGDPFATPSKISSMRVVTTVSGGSIVHGK